MKQCIYNKSNDRLERKGLGLDIKRGLRRSILCLLVVAGGFTSLGLVVTFSSLLFGITALPRLHNGGPRLGGQEHSKDETQPSREVKISNVGSWSFACTKGNDGNTGDVEDKEQEGQSRFGVDCHLAQVGHNNVDNTKDHGHSTQTEGVSDAVTVA